MLSIYLSIQGVCFVVVVVAGDDEEEDNNDDDDMQGTNEQTNEKNDKRTKAKKNFY
jgi:hypothetical protein